MNKQIKKTPKESTTVFLVYVSCFLFDSFFVQFEKMSPSPHTAWSAEFPGFSCTARISCVSSVSSFFVAALD